MLLGRFEGVAIQVEQETLETAIGQPVAFGDLKSTQAVTLIQQDGLQGRGSDVHALETGQMQFAEGLMVVVEKRVQLVFGDGQEVLQVYYTQSVTEGQEGGQERGVRWLD